MCCLASVRNFIWKIFFGGGVKASSRSLVSKDKRTKRCELPDYGEEMLVFISPCCWDQKYPDKNTLRENGFMWLAAPGYYSLP